MKSKLLFLVFAQMAVFGIGVRAQQIPSSEFNALVALYNATDGPNWTNNTGWNTATNNVDGGGWYGVTVENGHITELFLSQNGLAGTLPAALGDLSELTDLWISRNELTGPIPAELGNLSQLDILYLADNLLTGTIPAQLGDLSNLSVMYLNNNALTGAIPSELGEMSSMTDLNLATNQLAGTLPSELGDLSNLVYLSLHSNDFTGSIPPQLGNLSQLDWLRLWGNDLTGTIPTALGNLSNLSWLELMDNQLSGTIPQAIIDMANGGNRTTRIYLQDNNFTGIGTLPTTFFADFEVYNNQLDFADLAGNIGNLPATSYSPQRFPLLNPDSIALSMGDAFDLTVNPGGQNLTYLWQKNYTVLGMDTSSVSVSSATLGDAGIYFCTVTSPDLPELRIISDEVSITVDGLTSECGEDDGLPLGLIWRGAVISAQTNGSPDFQGVVNDSVTIIPTGQPNRYTISSPVAGAFGFYAPGDFYADCQGGVHLYETFSLGTVNDGSDYGGAFSSYDSATHTLRLSSYTYSPFPAFTTYAVTEFTPYVAPPTLSNRSVELSAASGATVGTLSSFIDPNSDSTQYTLVSGVGDADNALFQIVGAELRLVSGYSPAAPETLSVRVRALHVDRPYAMDSVFAIAVTEGPVSARIEGSAESLSIFPNPAGELLYIRFHGASGEAVECTIHDMSGRRMLTRTFTTSPVSTTHQLNLAALPPGLYLLKIETDAGTAMKKVIKN